VAGQNKRSNAKIMIKPGMQHEPIPALPWKGREPGSWLIFSPLWFLMVGVFIYIARNNTFDFD